MQGTGHNLVSEGLFKKDLEGAKHRRRSVGRRWRKQQQQQQQQQKKKQQQESDGKCTGGSLGLQETESTTEKRFVFLCLMSA
jgi:hypothetical protein